MSFVSISDLKEIISDDKRLVLPTLTINRRGTGYITRRVYGEIKPSTIEVEVDLVMGMIRLKTGDNLSKKLSGRLKHTFNVPVSLRRKIIPEGSEKLTIPLTKSDDGWWYGNYQQEAA